MANGFIGFASQRHFQRMRDVTQQASSMISSAGGSSSPNLAGFGEGNSHRLGVGTSENVVMREDVYRSCVARAQQLDDLMAERISYCVRQMDEMCQTIFIAPQTTPRVQAVLSQVQGVLGEFRDLTAQTGQVTQMYVSQTTALDR